MKKKDINSAYEENPVEDSPAEEPSGKKKKGKKNSVEQYKDNAKKSTNEFLMSTVDHDGDFDDYKQNSLDWSWDNIKK